SVPAWPGGFSPTEPCQMLPRRHRAVTPPFDHPPSRRFFERSWPLSGFPKGIEFRSPGETGQPGDDALLGMGRNGPASRRVEPGEDNSAPCQNAFGFLLFTNLLDPDPGIRLLYIV